MNESITIEQLRTRLQNGDSVQVVDVRSAGEFRSGHIAGAVSVPMDEIESRIEDLAAQGPVVLVCHSGSRAEICHKLVEAKRTNACYLEGGTAGWIEAGLPVVASSRTRWSLDRQVRLGAGVLVLTGVLLGVFVHPNWLGLAGFVGAGLTFAGLTDICGMAFVLAKLPWNLPKAGPTDVVGEMGRTA